MGGCNEEPKEVLQTFLEHDLGFRDAKNIEIQRVHCIEKARMEVRPIFWPVSLDIKTEEIFLLGHRIKGTNFQMF